MNEVDYLRGIARTFGVETNRSMNELYCLRGIVREMGVIPAGRNLARMNERDCLLAIVNGGGGGGGHPECTEIATIDIAGPYTYLQGAELEGRRLRMRVRVQNSQGIATSWTDASDIIAAAPPPINTALTDLTSTQGVNGWQAGKFDNVGVPASFNITGMVWDGPNARWKGPGIADLPFIATTYVHPSIDFGPAAARYTSSVTRDVTVTINATCDAGSSDGVDVRVWHNTTEISSFHINASASNSDVSPISMAPGDTITLEVDKFSNATGDITYINEFSIIE